jgi:SAM-dependent methyltransferase
MSELNVTTKSVASAADVGGLICPLCATATSTVVHQLTIDELRCAWRVAGIELASEHFQVFGGATTAALHACLACGFRFFDPKLAGDGAFYAGLQGSNRTYYAAERDEFRWALEHARILRLSRVLDLGCGSGAFLDAARARGLETHGTELNPAAAEVCRQKGHRVYGVEAESLARETEVRDWDLVTLFQVLEHVAHPVTFLRQITRWVRPGGYVVVGVPNEEGIYRWCPWDPHQWPPHHVTRWRKLDLRRLGDRCGLQWIDSGSDPVIGSQVESFWHLHHRLAEVLHKPPHPGGDRVIEGLSFLYRKLGVKYFFPRLGPSIYALFRKYGATTS